MNVNEILKLSDAEKILAVEQIWDSLDHAKITITDSQKNELDRRLAEYRAGKSRFFTWEEVKSQLRTTKDE